MPCYLTVKEKTTRKVINDIFNIFPPDSEKAAGSAAFLERTLNAFRERRGMPGVVVEVGPCEGWPSGDPLRGPLYILGFKFPWEDDNA